MNGNIESLFKAVDEKITENLKSFADMQDMAIYIDYIFWDECMADLADCSHVAHANDFIYERKVLGVPYYKVMSETLARTKKDTHPKFRVVNL